MAYGKIKADTLVYDGGGSDTEIALSQLANKADSANPTFTGTVIVPTVNANDNTTKAASTAYVQTELGDYLTTATATSTYAPKASPTFTGTPTVPGYATLASPTFTGTVNAAALTLSGNLQVNGTTTTVASSTMTVTDKNIEIAKGAANDAAADGAGITVDSGDGDKTWNWVDATDAWTSSEHIHLGDNKKLFLGTGKDLEIEHNGYNSFVRDTGTGNLYIDAATNFYIRKFDPGYDTRMIAANAGGSVDLYHNNIKKIETTAAGVTVTGTVTDTKGELRQIPRNHKTGAYTLIASDAGKMITITTGGVTVPNSVLAEGDAISIINQSGSDQTITQGSGFTIFNSADASTGNRTLAGRGMTTLWFTAADTAYISGAGLS